jgi:predicted GNAT family acetyltransferase
MDQEKIIIKHDEAGNRFYIDFESGEPAELKYRLQGERDIDFYSTYVPNTQRSQGLAAKLVKHGFEWAKQKELTLHATCWYARKFL